MDKTPLERACDALDGQGNLAAAIGVSPQAISQWVNRKRPLPLERVKDIVRATSGRITAHDLAPDTFPAGFEFPPEQEPAAA